MYCGQLCAGITLVSRVAHDKDVVEVGGTVLVVLMQDLIDELLVCWRPCGYYEGHASELEHPPGSAEGKEVFLPHVDEDSLETESLHSDIPNRGFERPEHSL